MDNKSWHAKRRELSEKEKQYRSDNWQESRPPLQAAITEQAVIELFSRVEALEQERQERRSERSTQKG